MTAVSSAKRQAGSGSNVSIAFDTDSNRNGPNLALVSQMQSLPSAKIGSAPSCLGNRSFATIYQGVLWPKARRSSL